MSFFKGFKVPAILKKSPILVVDDSLIMRQMIKSILSGLGYTRVEEASNGVAAVEKVEEAKNAGDCVRAIFLDWAMPEMDGLTFLRICRSDAEMAHVPIIMVTAISEQSSMVEALKEGATAYITKPFVPEKVAETLKLASTWAENNGSN